MRHARRPAIVQLLALESKVLQVVDLFGGKKPSWLSPGTHMYSMPDCGPNVDSSSEIV